MLRLTLTSLATTDVVDENVSQPETLGVWQYALPLNDAYTHKIQTYGTSTNNHFHRLWRGCHIHVQSAGVRTDRMCFRGRCVNMEILWFASGSGRTNACQLADVFVWKSHQPYVTKAAVWTQNCKLNFWFCPEGEYISLLFVEGTSIVFIAIDDQLGFR